MAKKQAAEVADSLRQFKQDLKNNTLGNFYIFCGEEAFLRDYYLAELTKKLSNGPAAEFNVHRFDAASIAPQASRRTRAMDRIFFMQMTSLINYF